MAGLVLTNVFTEMKELTYAYYLICDNDFCGSCVSFLLNLMKDCSKQRNSKAFRLIDTLLTLPNSIVNVVVTGAG